MSRRGLVSARAPQCFPVGPDSLADNISAVLPNRASVRPDVKDRLFGLDPQNVVIYRSIRPALG